MIVTKQENAGHRRARAVGPADVPPLLAFTPGPDKQFDISYCPLGYQENGKTAKGATFGQKCNGC
jgi:hypothetical protein